MSYSPTKAFNLIIEKSGYTPVNTSAKGQITKEEVVEPVFLTHIDPIVTTITPAVGGVATNSAGDTQVIFPPGSAPRDIDVTITMFDGEKELPAPLGKSGNFSCKWRSWHKDKPHNAKGLVQTLGGL